MKRILPAALVLALATGIATAQAPVVRQPADPAVQAQRHQHHGAKHLAKALNLSADQQTKLEPIMADRRQKVAALRADTTLDPKSRHQQMRAIHQSTEQQLSGILTPDQLQQMKSMRHKHGRKGGGEPVPPPPAV